MGWKACDQSAMDWDSACKEMLREFGGYNEECVERWCVMTAVEALPVYKKAKEIAQSRGENLTSLIGAYLSGYVAAGYGPRSVVKVNTVRRFDRSESGRAIMSADWDDPEDAIYDNA